MKRRCNGFTLVELLVVICLASLLFGIVLPAFSRMVTGSAVDRLSSNLKLRLEQAQSHAASSRRHVALILPSGADSTDAKLDAARLGGSRMCYVDWDSDNYKATFVDWVSDEDWTQPERGAFLIGVYKSDPIKDDGTLKKKGTGEGEIYYAVSRTGALVSETSGNDKPLKDVGSFPGGDKNNCAVVFSPKGYVRTSGKEIFLVVAEASDSGTELLFPGGAPHNFKALRINPVNGRVRYFSK